MAFGGIYNKDEASTLLERMLNEISYHRVRKITHYSREESGFVILNTTNFWNEFFLQHFLHQCENRDDMLFFVRKHEKRGVSRYIPKFETAIEVFRKDSRKLPKCDPDIDWEETVYLNLILQEFEYTLTCAVCTRTSSKDLQILKKNSQKVYASPSRRSMNCKGDTEEISYPNIFFTIDNYEEVFEDIIVRDGEIVCVELVAADKEGALQRVLFLGSIHYDAVKRVYDARASLSSKFAQKVSLGWYQEHQRLEFVRMRGPNGKGYAEMAVTKQKGSGVETPTSEPGYSITDYDWEDMEEDSPYLQRRMSDPSSNLNTYVRSWKSRQDIKKSQSETEVDYYSNGINEIEAGDIRDDLIEQINSEENAEKTYKIFDFTTKPNRCKVKKNQQTKYYIARERKKYPDRNSNEDLSKIDDNAKELDDPTYNKLWTLHGFGQAYHFWKESRRASSPALNAYLTYVTLPWHSIIADILDSRQNLQPILTF
ncbi:uncharacterized protein KIAA0930 homolog [Caerostris darwini]|uniref:Uncharacterized protein KIAA0930 homolog n=1 Tax=Caerostris darwini TaxID=1538125 RepID=A0AAV4T100_9ARAC|nr:uncharacterized protein KIAA0930 homolog [Caerostris darwini]